MHGVGIEDERDTAGSWIAAQDQRQKKCVFILLKAGDHNVAAPEIDVIAGQDACWRRAERQVGGLLKLAIVVD
jgi:hypothetical protein